MNICTHNYTATDVLLGGFITISYTIRPLFCFYWALVEIHLPSLNCKLHLLLKLS